MGEEERSAASRRPDIGGESVDVKGATTDSVSDGGALIISVPVILIVWESDEWTERPFEA